MNNVLIRFSVEALSRAVVEHILKVLAASRLFDRDATKAWVSPENLYSAISSVHIFDFILWVVHQEVARIKSRISCLVLHLRSYLFV